MANKKHTYNDIFKLKIRQLFRQKIENEWQLRWKIHGESLSVANMTALVNDLIDDIKAKTCEIIGEATLKRLFDDSYEGLLNKSNLDIIAKYLNYKNFQDFKNKNPEYSKETVNNELINTKNDDKSNSLLVNVKQQKPTGTNKRYKRLFLKFSQIITPIFIAASCVFMYIEVTTPSIEIAQVIKNPTTIFPCTIQVEYQLYNNIPDSFSIEFSERHYPADNQKITDSRGLVSNILFYPCVLQINLKEGSQIVKTIPYVAESDGWQGFYSVVNCGKNPKRMGLKDKNMFYSDGYLHFPKDSIKINDSTDFYWTKFIYLHDFGIQADDCSVKFQFKNSEVTGGFSCYDAGFTIYGKTGQKIVGNFVEEGCNYFSYLNVSEVNISRNTSTEIAKLDIKNANFQCYEVKIHNNTLSLIQNADTLFSSISYTKPLGNLCGFDFFFKGSGILDYVKVLDGKNKLRFNDNF